MKRATPIITVDSIEPCLPFWTDQLGFELLGTVPHEDTVGFAMMQKGDVELMYQSRASIDADLGAQGRPGDLGTELSSSTATIYMEVDDLDEVITAVGDVPVVVERRETFYGMDEIWVRPPCGTLVGFATKVPQSEEAS